MEFNTIVGKHKAEVSDLCKILLLSIWCILAPKVWVQFVCMSVETPHWNKYDEYAHNFDKDILQRKSQTSVKIMVVYLLRK